MAKINVIQNWQEVEHFSTIINLEMLRQNEYNLNAFFYLNAIQIERQLINSITLNEVSDILPGVQVPASDLEILKRNATHYFLNVKNIQDDEILCEEEDLIRDKKVNWYGKYDIQAGVRIINASKLGNVEIPKYELEKCLQVGERIKASTLKINSKRLRAKKL